MRRELGGGGRASAIRAYGRLRVALREELGIVPGAEVQGLYERCIAGLEADAPEIVGRELELAAITALLRAEAPPQLLALRGPAGIGKSALCRDLGRLGRAEGWFVVSVTATEGGASYAPLAQIAEALIADRPELVIEIGARLALGARRADAARGRRRGGTRGLRSPGTA